MVHSSADRISDAVTRADDSGFAHQEILAILREVFGPHKDPGRVSAPVTAGEITESLAKGPGYPVDYWPAPLNALDHSAAW
jgi:hypothetical protein